MAVRCVQANADRVGRQFARGRGCLLRLPETDGSVGLWRFDEGRCGAAWLIDGRAACFSDTMAFAATMYRAGSKTMVIRRMATSRGDE